MYDPIVTFSASKPGVLKVLQVCNSLECCTRPEKMESRIWALPRAIVGDGEFDEEDIREGDEYIIKVKLEGQSPFSFSWARTFGGVTESFNVEGVEKEEYGIVAGKEGFYEVTSVNDRYCGFPGGVEEADANVSL